MVAGSNAPTSIVTNDSTRARSGHSHEHGHADDAELQQALEELDERLLAENALEAGERRQPLNFGASGSVVNSGRCWTSPPARPESITMLSGTASAERGQEPVFAERPRAPGIGGILGHWRADPQDAVSRRPHCRPRSRRPGCRRPARTRC